MNPSDKYEIEYYKRWGNIPDYTFPYPAGTEVRILCDVIVESEKAGDLIVGLKGCKGTVYKYDLVDHQGTIYRIPSGSVEHCT